MTWRECYQEARTQQKRQSHTPAATWCLNFEAAYPFVFAEILEQLENDVPGVEEILEGCDQQRIQTRGGDLSLLVVELLHQGPSSLNVCLLFLRCLETSTKAMSHVFSAALVALFESKT